METVNELKPNEILFMGRMINEIMPNRQHVNTASLREIAAIVGIDVNVSCRSCTQAGSADVLNRFHQLKPKYDLYLESLKSTFDIHIQEVPIETILPESKPKIKKK